MLIKLKIIGGEKFHVSRDAMQAHKGSYFESLISGDNSTR